MADPIKAKNLNFNYVEAEDRLIIVVQGEYGEKLGLFLTRRLTERLVNGFAGILEKSSPMAAQAPAEMRGDVVLLEHQGALEGAGSKGTSSTAAAAGSGASPAIPRQQQIQITTALISSVDISTKPTHFEIVIKSVDKVLVRFDINRSGLHRVIGLLTEKAEEAADWNIRIEASWLEAGQTTLTVN